jgi:DNA-binding MarR family transcriptional regulator
MPTENTWFEDIVFPALLRHARTAYGAAMRKGLAEVGCDDIPKNGMWVIGGLALGAEDVPLSELVRDLGVSKQAAGQLVDTLVLRGYLERQTDAEDRRRLTVTLTARGRMAAAAQMAARERIDAALLKKVGAEKLRHARETLGALARMARENRDAA